MIEYTNIHIPEEFFFMRIIYYLPFVYKRLDRYLY